MQRMLKSLQTQPRKIYGNATIFGRAVGASGVAQQQQQRGIAGDHFRDRATVVSFISWKCQEITYSGIAASASTAETPILGALVIVFLPGRLLTSLLTSPKHQNRLGRGEHHSWGRRVSCQSVVAGMTVHIIFSNESAWNCWKCICRNSYYCAARWDVKASGVATASTATSGRRSVLSGMDYKYTVLNLLELPGKVVLFWIFCILINCFGRLERLW